MPVFFHPQPPESRRWFRRVPLVSRLSAVPHVSAWAVLVAGLLFTAILTAQYERMQHENQVLHFEDAVDSMTRTIQSRLRNFRTTLSATVGLFEARTEVAPDEFERFIHRLELETFYAGLQTIGFVQRVAPGELEALRDRMMRYPEDGYRGFRLLLADGVQEHLIITHLEPQDEHTFGAIGIDLAGMSQRREAMEESIIRNAATATEVIDLLPEIEPHDLRGLVVYMPAYREGEVEGFAFASFRVSALLSVILGAFPDVAFKVFDAPTPESEDLIFQRASTLDEPQNLKAKRTVAVAGRTWTITFEGSPTVDFWLPLLPIAGLMVSGVFAAFVWNLSKARGEAAERAELLQQQREWLAVTLGSIGDAVLATDNRGRVTFMNSRAQEMTGWGLDEVLGKGAEEVLRLVDERTGERLPNPVRAVLDACADVGLPPDIVLVCRDGRRIPIDDIGAPIRSASRDDDTAIIGAVITFRDISERRKHERALRESQARLQFVLESAQLGDWDLDLVTGSAIRSPRHDQIFGYDEPLESWDYQTFLDHVHPDDRDEVAARFDKAIVEGEDWFFQCRNLRPDSSVHWIETHGSIYERDSAGRPTRMLGLVEDVTERKQVEEDLRRSEQRFRSLVTATSSIIWTASGDGLVEHEVASWEAFTGQTPEQYLGGGWLEALHPDDRDNVASIWAEVNRSREPFHLRYRLRHHSGEYRRVDARGVPILDERGEIREWVGSITDIEEQERVAEALLRAEQRYRWIIESAVDFAIFTFDIEGRIDSWNSGAERVLGYAEDEIIGQDVSIIFTPADRRARQPEQERREAMQYVSALDERWHVRADGERFFAAGRVTTLKDDQGYVHGFVKILHDRTKEQEALEALERRTQELQESETRFRTMADTAPVYIWMADTIKACTWFNKPWLEFTGRTLEEEVGTGWTEGVHPDDLQYCLDTFNEYFDARRSFKMQYRLRRHDGEYRWVLARGLPLHEPDGTFSGYIGSCIDITELEQARETLERYSTDLERLVNERTEKLRESNEQLRLSERMASLGTLAAGIGHDLGNLLLPMRIRLDIIDKHMPEAQRENVQVLRTSAEYLGNLAKGLRYLSTDPERADGAGGDALTELSVWWHEARPLLQNILPNHVSLESALAENLSRVQVSPAALTQAVFNLVQNSGNALRRHHKGTVRVWADMEASQQTGPQFVRLGVTDDGPGMDEEVKRRCVEPFYSTKTREFSTGLGLSLVQGVVRRCEGRMEIHSELGQGTTIILILPAAKSPRYAAERAHRPLAAVVVQDPRIRAFVKSELDSMGYETVVDGRPVIADAARAENGEPTASLWVVDAHTLTGSDNEEDVTNRGQNVAKSLQEIIERDRTRRIVLLGYPQQVAEAFSELDAWVIPTSSTFKPSEIREALRKAARQSAAHEESNDGHGEFPH